MVRPVDVRGSHLFGIRNRKDFIRLLLLAAHEVTHFTHETHNEDFSNLNLEINHRLFADLGNIVNKLKAVLSSEAQIAEVVRA
jgi:hypothetical protein